MAEVDVITEAVIPCPVAEVAEYAADPTNAPRWYANITTVEWETSPPVDVGSRVAFVARFLGGRIAYTYEVIEYEPQKRLVMRTAHGPFPMETTYVWTPADDGTRMTLRNRGMPAGFGAIAAPVIAAAMRRANEKDLQALTAVLTRRRPRGGTTMAKPLHERVARRIGRGGGLVLRNRLLMRLPIRVYQARLGGLFGTRLLMLEHVGRLTGMRRRVVLEVVEHRAPGRYVVASGLGPRAQWFRNVSVEPRVRVWLGGRAPVDADARVLSIDEADAVLAAYVGRHRRAWAVFKPVLEHALGAPIAEHGTALPMVELRLRHPTR